MALLITAVAVDTSRGRPRKSRGIISGHVPIALRVRLVIRSTTRLLL